MDMNMGTNNYSVGGTIGPMLLILTKLLTLVLVVAIVAGIIVWIRDAILKNSNAKFIKDIKNDPILKAITVITAAILGLVLIFTLFNSLLHPGYRAGVHMGNLNAGFYYGYNPMSSIVGILMVFIRLLMIVFVISLVLAGVMYFKTQYENGKLNIFANNTNQSNNNNSNDNNNVIVKPEEENQL